MNDELENRVRGYFADSEYGSKIELHGGHALDIIPTLDEQWDLVFIDADKENYAAYYDDRTPEAGGWIVADNVLWSGKVLDPEEGMDAGNSPCTPTTRRSRKMSVWPPCYFH